MKLLSAVASGTPTLNTMHHCEALVLLRALPDASVDLIVTDPPYFGYKDEAWDNQWLSVAE
jgi:adenine-specific DNA-methyltransferase